MVCSNVESIRHGFPTRIHFSRFVNIVQNIVRFCEDDLGMGVLPLSCGL